MTLTIHADPITVNCRKVLAGLELIGAPYTLARIDYFAGEHKAADYLALNPNGTLPTLTDTGRDLILWESNAILQYAADQQQRADLYPTELTARANINRWLLWEAASWFPACYVYLVENCAKPLMGETPDSAALAAHRETYDLLAVILDQQLSRTPWLCGDVVTIADIAVAAPLHMHEAAAIPLADHPHLHRWMTSAIEPLPCWQSTYVGPGFTTERPE